MKTVFFFFGNKMLPRQNIFIYISQRKEIKSFTFERKKSEVLWGIYKTRYK